MKEIIPMTEFNQPIREDSINLHKTLMFISMQKKCEKSTSSLTSFLGYCKLVILST